MRQIEARTGGPRGRVVVVRHAFTTLFTEGIEWQERLLLLNRPWNEQLLHWGADGQLHGVIAPQPGQRSTTRSGWCSGLS